MKTPFVEQDCTFTHEGQDYTSGGAVVTDSFIIGYMSSDMSKVTTWHGEVISEHVIITAKWRTPKSYVSSVMYQVKVKFGGRWYTGRTAGGSMIVRLKVCK